MNSLYEILTGIQSTSSKLEKQKILEQNKQNILLCDTLQFVYNPQILSGLSTKKIKKVIRLPPNNYLLTLQDCYTYLVVNNTGTDQDISNIQTFLNSLNPKYQIMCENILKKSLKLGCDSKTINKAFLIEFIKTHDVQQAYPLEKHKLTLAEWISLSQKLNGIHGSYHKGEMISRQGHIINGLDHIIKDIKALNLADPFIDGELIRDNKDNLSDNENFRLTTSILSSDDLDKSDIKFVFYEVLTSEEFLRKKSFYKYKDRLKNLLNISEVVKRMGLKNIKLVDILYTGTDHTRIKKCLDLMDSQGKEGAMLNRDTFYECKRNKGILKVKSFHHCDVRCKRIELGTGKNAATLGSIVVDYKGYECGVGSGFTDEQREFYFNNQDEILGRIVQVKYKDESKNKNGGLSLQFPIFECVRNDKTEPSYN